MTSVKFVLKLSVKVWVALSGSFFMGRVRSTLVSLCSFASFLWGFCHLRQFPSFTVLFSRKILYSAVVTLDFFCWLFGFDFYVSILFNMFFFRNSGLVSMIFKRLVYNKICFNCSTEIYFDLEYFVLDKLLNLSNLFVRQ